MNNRFTNTIHEIRHFTLMTELLTLTIYFAFLCKPIWGNATVPLVLTSFGERRPPKYLENGVAPRSASPSNTPLATAVIFKSKITISLQCPRDLLQNLLNTHLKLYLSNKTANINGKNWPVYNQV